MRRGYHLEGKVNIPQDKKEEFNTHVMRILDKCGIRKTATVILNGKEHTVIDMPKPDEHGIVYFDYSIFGQQNQKVSSYNMNTCQLNLETPIGFSVQRAMLLIMMLQEVYSGGECYLLFDGCFCSIYEIVRILNEVLGTKLSLPERDNIWDAYLFMKKIDATNNMNVWKFQDNCVNPNGKTNTHQLVCLLYITESDVLSLQASKEEKEMDVTKPLAIEICRTLEKLFGEYGEDNTYTYLKSLLAGALEDRQEMSQQEHPCAILAKLSLHVHPALLVYAYSEVIKKDFWDVWFGFDFEVYTDYLDVDDARTKKKGRADASTDEEVSSERFLYRYFEVEDENSFIEFWGEDNLCLSGGMQQEMQQWKNCYSKLKAVDTLEFVMEQELSKLLDDMYDIWKCRYVDKVFVDEFLAHKDEEEYKRAIVLFRELLDTDMRYFPELTKAQVRMWVTKQGSNKMHREYLNGYQSLLCNHLHRQEFFGF